jgi:hypothetical protein
MSLQRIAIATVLALFAVSASAQSFEASVHLASSQWSEFDGTDIGGGARLTFKPIAMIGLDADVTWYPGDFPPDGVPFTGNRLEGFLGVTAGPRLAGFRPFAKVAGGFMKTGDAPAPFACIAIFPPPLNCLMGGAQTMPAFEIGGGVELTPTGRVLLRFDITDRFLKYPGPTFDSNFDLKDAGFFGGALRFTLGAGIRF